MRLLTERRRPDVVTAAGTALPDGARPVLALPEMEVLGSVVETVPVDVVNGFRRQERAAEELGHHKPVLEDVAAARGVRVVGFVHSEVGAQLEGLAVLGPANTLVASVSPGLGEALVPALGA